MTVSELIAELQSLPPEAQVRLHGQLSRSFTPTDDWLTVTIDYHS